MEKQTDIALSIMKVEFIVYSTIIQETVWLGSFFFWAKVRNNHRCLSQCQFIMTVKLQILFM